MFLGFGLGGEREKCSRGNPESAYCFFLVKNHFPSDLSGPRVCCGGPVGGLRRDYIEKREGHTKAKTSENGDENENGNGFQLEPQHSDKVSTCSAAVK